MTPSAPGQFALKIAGNVSSVAYVILAFLVVYNSTRVFQAMPNRALRDASAAGLIFPPGVTGPISGE